MRKISILSLAAISPDRSARRCAMARAGLGAWARLGFACAGPPAASAPPRPPAAPPPRPPEAAASTAPIPFRTLPCAEIIGTSDDDRAVASIFCLGYQAAVSYAPNPSIAQIQAIDGKALSICAATPQMPAVRAFHAAIRTHAR